jgi:DNA primase
MRWLMNFFGVETEGISVGKTTTQNYIARVLAYYSSVGVWFDEYRNETGVVEKDGFFRSAYNRQLSGKGTATAFQAKGFSVHATLAISGEELPRDNGLFTRCIPLQVSSYKRQRDWFEWININANQFSGFTYELLLAYDLYKPKIMASIAEMKKALVKRGVTDRTAENWAICAGAFWAVVEQDSEFIKWVEKTCQDIKKAGEEDHMLNQFWDDVNILVSEGTISSKYFKVIDQGRLFVWFAGVFETWAIHYKKKTGREPFEKQSIIKYLQEEPYFGGDSRVKINISSGSMPLQKRGITINLDLATDTIKEIADIAEASY